MPSASTSSATLTWTAPGDDGSTGTASVYDIRYSTSTITEANWNTTIQVNGEPEPQVAGSLESFVVPDLEPALTYYFAIKVADEVPNWSNLSNVASITTDPEEDAPAAVADLQIIDLTDTTVTLIWTATGDDGEVGTASTYDMRYSTSTITDANWNSATQVNGEPQPQVAGSLESFTVTGLEQEVTYFFAIMVADEIPNWSSLSNIVSATTPDETPPGGITSLQAVIEN